MIINPHMFREYDIRGVVGKDLTTEFYYQFGLVFAGYVQEKSQLPHPLVVVGRDGRLSSPELSAALMQGLAAAGAQVVDVGLTPTPGLYFASHHFQATAGIMVTGSHNPPDQNGLKMMLGKGSVYGAAIQELQARLVAGRGCCQEGGNIRQESVLAQYVAAMKNGLQVGRPIKVVVDCGNGAAGVVAHDLFSHLPNVEAELMYAEVDGTFPNHHPDPTLPETLASLRQRMLATKAELGIAFDGDGDRLGALDEQGNIVWGDRLLILFARFVLARQPKAMVIGDVKCSQLLFDAVAKAGGQPVMWKTGHSLVKAKMQASGAVLAGEMSGHLFFADRYFGFDDGLYAAVRLIEAVAAEESFLSQRFADLPPILATPEVRIPCPDDKKFAVVEAIRHRLQQEKADMFDLDGVRVKEQGGWWLLRVSNTQPVLVARAEANNRASLMVLGDRLQTLLLEHQIDTTSWQKGLQACV